jgi:hypothetical protein
LSNGIKISLCLRRFASEWNRIYKYRGLVFLDCDTTPRSTQEDYDKSINFIYNSTISIPEYNIVNKTSPDILGLGFINPGYDNSHAHLLEYANNINYKYNITNQNIQYNFPISDGPFRAYRFNSEFHMKQFFTLIHNIVEDILVYKKYDKLAQHSVWKIHVEYVLAIVCNLLNIETYLNSRTNGIARNYPFRVECYPEDRFWCFSAGFENSRTGKLDFVNKNYLKLKEFYDNKSQEFPY